MAWDPNQLVIPYLLRVGVTGHRQLENPTAVAAAVRRTLDRIATVLDRPERVPLRWRVVSPLAAGADQIVADAVLQRDHHELEVLLPFDAAEYRRDFTEKDSLEIFDRLLKSAEESDVTVVSDRADVEDQQARNLAYLVTGQRVVDACELLIAIWNPEASAGEGGTRDIVAYALHNGRDVLWLDPLHPELPARMLRRSPGLDHESLETWARSDIHPELPATAAELSPGFHQLDAFLRDDAVSAAKLTATMKTEADRLVTVADAAGLMPATYKPILDVILPVYVRADVLARHYRNRHVRWGTALFYLSAVAVTVAAFQLIFMREQFQIVAIEIVALLVALGAWFAGRRRAWHEKWLHDRFLAEQLRIACFTSALNVDPSKIVIQLQERMPFYIGPRNWLAATTNQVVEEVLTSLRTVTPPGLEAIRSFIREGWLIDQMKYHAANARMTGRRVERTERLVPGIFIVTLGVAIAHFMLPALWPDHHDNPAANAFAKVDNWLGFLAVVLPAWGAAIHAAARQMEWERIATRSQQMARVFQRLEERAEISRSAADLTDICNEAVEKTALENYEWWVLLSFMPPELVP